jgi:hypothetical protein
MRCPAGGIELAQSRQAVKGLSRHKKGVYGYDLRIVYMVLFHDPLDSPPRQRFFVTKRCQGWALPPPKKNNET